MILIEYPTKIIIGHDGSSTIAFNDYRDNLLLDLEKRIYNNIKIEYDTDKLDIHDFFLEHIEILNLIQQI